MTSKPDCGDRVHAILYSQWQQAIAENAEYEQFLKRLNRLRQTCPSDEEFATAVREALEQFGRRMKPVLAMRKARPK